MPDFSITNYQPKQEVLRYIDNKTVIWGPICETKHINRAIKIFNAKHSVNNCSIVQQITICYMVYFSLDNSDETSMATNDEADQAGTGECICSSLIMYCVKVVSSILFF